MRPRKAEIPSSLKTKTHGTNGRFLVVDLDPSTQTRSLYRMEIIVDKMFQRCFEDQEYKQALGIAVEASRMDIITAAINKSVRLYVI